MLLMVQFREGVEFTVDDAAATVIIGGLTVDEVGIFVIFAAVEDEVLVVGVVLLEAKGDRAETIIGIV